MNTTKAITDTILHLKDDVDNTFDELKLGEYSELELLEGLNRDILKASKIISERIKYITPK